MSDVTNSKPIEESPAQAPAISTPRRPLTRLWWGIALAALFAIPVFALCITSEIGVLPSIVVALFFSAFGGSLTLEDSAVREVISFMATRTIAFPGLIWEFSFDGFIWLIGMKLLFWVIGLLFGVLCAIVGVIVAVIIAPFAYPFNLVSYIKEG